MKEKILWLISVLLVLIPFAATVFAWFIMFILYKLIDPKIEIMTFKEIIDFFFN